MGNHVFKDQEKLPEVSKEVLSHFSKTEIRLIKATFKDLAMRSPGNSIDRTTFLKHFPLPGLHGEQLFDIFDYKKTGVLDYTEFITGFALCCRGSVEEKFNLIFKIYDITKDGAVSKMELATMLHQVPYEAIRALQNKSKNPPESVQVNTGESTNSDSNTKTKEKAPSPLRVTVNNEPDKADIIDQMVEEAFETCDLNKNGRLSFDQFKLWVANKPEVMEFLDSAFDHMFQPSSPSSSGADEGANKPSTPSSPKFLVGMLSPNLPRKNLSSTNIALGLERDNSDASRTPTGSRKNFLTPGGEMGSIDAPVEDDIDISSLSKEGWLSKKGRRFNLLSHRHYKLQGNIMFYFSSKSSRLPNGVILLSGCFVDPIKRIPTGPESKLFGFKIVTGVGGVRDTRVFYAKTEKERDEWVGILRSASRDRKFVDSYIWKEKIGTGKFSNVYKCEHRKTGEQYAVKVIKKKNITTEENELLRTEIAILRLVNHRNIVQLVDVFETLENLFIVMELLNGGELYHHIVGRSRFSEHEAYILLCQLCEGLEYLHAAGIVHRDLKPENILLNNKMPKGTKLDSTFELKLSDFGLSKLVAPNEIMKLPCGTISYVAPEVLSLKGYGIEADLWSIGVIMYLVLRGKLPFNSEDKEDIIEEILNEDLEWNTDKIWSQMNQELVSIIAGLLEKDPSKRLTAKLVLEHPWMVSMKEKFPMAKSPSKSRRTKNSDLEKSEADDKKQSNNIDSDVHLNTKSLEQTVLDDDTK